jgi:prophage DNA circulation protein
MSIDSALGALQSITTTIGSASNIVARTAMDLGAAGPAAGAYWKDSLRPASFRGVSFGVLGATGKFGRRNAVHEYPFRDKTWVEDLGKSARRINISGFLVGEDCIAQRERMIAAAEGAGDGELIHPTLGRLKVSTIEFTTEEKWDRGRVFEVTFAFIEAGDRIFPSVVPSTGDAVTAAAAAADKAASGDFLASTLALVKKGASVVSQVASTAAAWGRQAQRLANDATNLHNMVGSLSGGFGRYFKGGGIAGAVAAVGAVASASNSISGLIALGSRARSAVSSAIGKMTSAATEIGS